MPPPIATSTSATVTTALTGELLARCWISSRMRSSLIRISPSTRWRRSASCSRICSSRSRSSRARSSARRAASISCCRRSVSSRAARSCASLAARSASARARLSSCSFRTRSSSIRRSSLSANKTEFSRRSLMNAFHWGNTIPPRLQREEDEARPERRRQIRDSAADLLERGEQLVDCGVVTLAAGRLLFVLAGRRRRRQGLRGRRLARRDLVMRRSLLHRRLAVGRRDRGRRRVLRRQLLGELGLLELYLGGGLGRARLGRFGRGVGLGGAGGDQRRLARLRRELERATLPDGAAEHE